MEYCWEKPKYTSLASFLDADNLPNYRKKADNWKPSETGKEQSVVCIEQVIIGILMQIIKSLQILLKKSAPKLGPDLSQLCRGTLTCPREN